MNYTKKPYTGYRYPAEIINHVVWLYFRFTLSDRDVEELLAARGLIVTDETVRQWCLKFGQDFAHERRRRSPRRGDQWHLDEVYLRINGRRFYLWRAVDQDGFRAGQPDSAAPQPARRPAFLSQAPQGTALCPAGHHHRPAQERRSRPKGTDSQG